ncbi:MAG TPA: hypothetical protein VIX40_04040, partial [Methylomirabilota bacterium]
VKIGIGRPGPPEGTARRRPEVVDHVRSPVFPDEGEVVEAACAEAAQHALRLLESHHGARA